MIRYSLTIFLSAFLLFQVQPLIAKMIVPWFGGAAAVWLTCLLFFQVVLLLGYLYAFWLTKYLRPGARVLVHAALLGASVLTLPIIPKAGWRPPGPSDPTIRILGLLAVTVGLPYFLLSSTSPLVQAWYGRARPGVSPYRLYALSNAGSMLALASYPIAVEPFFSTRHQAAGWSAGYAVFAIMCGALAFTSRRGEAAPASGEGGGKAGWRLQALWLALAATGTTLLFAVTNHLTQNVAAIPFLWLLPLTMYLLSFILCFEGTNWYRRNPFVQLMAVALGTMSYALSPDYENAGLVLLVPLYSVGLFLCCMVCHGELARLKPEPSQLTSFYLMVALGGALGGFFVAFLAPRLFRGYFELATGLASCATLVLIVLRRDPTSPLHGARWKPAWLGAVALGALLIGDLAFEVRKQIAQPRLMLRNFYGVLRVIELEPEPEEDSDSDTPEQVPARMKLMNGTIDHGLQFHSSELRRQPTTYYGPSSGVGLAIQEAESQGALRVGVVGLGAGTVATYGRAGDRYVFYEINPLVIRIAQSEFSFLKDSVAEVEIVPGDARLALERESPRQFDVLAVDAFSGDAIPVHLLTREAFALYFRHLKPTGVVAVHITNRYLDLEPVLQAAAESFAKPAVVVRSDKDYSKEIYEATWVLLSGRREFFENAEIRKVAASLRAKRGLRVWTDDYVSLLRILKGS